MQPIDDTSANPPKPTGDQPWPYPFSKAEWEHAPTAIRAYILALQQMIEQMLVEHQKTIAALQKRIEELEARVNRNSSNSNQPPSSDSPFRKQARQNQAPKAGWQARAHRPSPSDAGTP